MFTQGSIEIYIVIAVIIIAILSFLFYNYNKHNLNENTPNAKLILIISTVFIVIGALPLIIYPFALIANIMQLASFGMLRERELYQLKSILMFLFIILTTLYPLTFKYSFTKFSTAINKILISLLPIIHLALAALMYFILEKID